MPIEQNIGSDIASRILSVSQATITRMCRKGIFPNATQDGQGHPWHIPLEDIIAYCEQKGIKSDKIESLLS